MLSLKVPSETKSTLRVGFGLFIAAASMAGCKHPPGYLGDGWGCYADVVEYGAMEPMPSGITPTEMVSRAMGSDSTPRYRLAWTAGDESFAVEVDSTFDPSGSRGTASVPRYDDPMCTTTVEFAYAPGRLEGEGFLFEEEAVFRYIDESPVAQVFLHGELQGSQELDAWFRTFLPLAAEDQLVTLYGDASLRLSSPVGPQEIVLNPVYRQGDELIGFEYTDYAPLRGTVEAIE